MIVKQNKLMDGMFCRVCEVYWEGDVNQLFPKQFLPNEERFVFILMDWQCFFADFFQQFAKEGKFSCKVRPF